MRIADQDCTALSPQAEPSPGGSPADEQAPARSSVAPNSDLRRTAFLGSDPFKIGPYQVGHLIGRGGMGEVFAGFDPRLDRAVAIKRLIPSDSPQTDDDFLSEARHAARLSHPGIVRLYDVVRVDETDYMISELIDGVSLGQLMQSGDTARLSLERVLEIGIAVTDALDYAHENGVVHRDIKASNVLVARNGEVKLGDFGIAMSMRGLGPPAVPVSAGTLSGTYSAMSPEQSIGEYTDARSDLFSFGVLLYEMVTGISPFSSPDPATCFRQVREARPLPLTEVLSEVPVALSRLVERLLEKRRDDRPESAREVKAELCAVADRLKASRESGRPGAPIERQLAVACLLWERSTDVTRPGLDMERRLGLLDVLHEAVVRAGGTLLTGAGSHAIFCIGYPTAQENNCEIAIRLLLSLEGRAGLPAGTLAGGVDCGLLTLLHRQGVLAAGEAIDHAVRLAHDAELGSVSVTLAAQTLARRFFRFTPLANPLREPSRTTPVYRVAEAISHDAGIEQVSATPLRARVREIEMLDRAFQDAQQGIVVTRLVVGDAGVGKSRLLNEWRRRTWQTADLMLTGYATTHEQYSPFAPLVRLWRQRFGLHASGSGSASAQQERDRLDEALTSAGLNVGTFGTTLAYAFGIPRSDNPLNTMPSERRRRQLIDTFVGLALELARKRFVVLTFEDLHFVDRSTLEVLRRMAGSALHVRLLLVLTARPEFLPSWPFTDHISKVNVGRLSATDALLLIESLTSGSPLPAGATRKLVELGDGVPLVLEELTRSLLGDVNRAHTSGDGGAVYHPTSLADSVIRRIDELGAARETICAAAALGRESPLALLRAIVDVGEEEFKSRLRKLEVAGLIHVRAVGGEERCIFSHALVQEAIRGAMAPGEARELHRKIVNVLENAFVNVVEAESERFAHLYASAGACSRALDLLERAANRAALASAYAEASAHIQSALSLLQSGLLDPNVEVERRLRRALGPLLMATEGWSAEAVADNLNRSRALGEESSELRELWGSWAHGLVTHDASGVSVAMTAIGRLPPSPEQRFVTLSTAGVTAFYRGRFSDARRYLEQSVAMLPQTDDAPLRNPDCLELSSARAWGCEFVVAASMHLSWMEALSGRRDRVEAVQGHAERLLRSLCTDPEAGEVRHALYMRVLLGLTLHDYEYYGYGSFAASSGPLHELFQLAGSRFPYYRCVAQLGEARGRAAVGDDGALDDLEDVYRRIKSFSRRPMGHVFFATMIAEACLERGQPARAEGLLSEALEVGNSEFGRFYVPEAYRIAAEGKMGAGDAPGAREALRRARSALLALDAPLESPALYFEQRIERTEAHVLGRAHREASLRESNH